jgi:hypothetical protein
VSQVSPESTTPLPQLLELLLLEPHAETSGRLISPKAIIEPMVSPLIMKFLHYCLNVVVGQGSITSLIQKRIAVKWFYSIIILVP